jgi:hypothetical protein
MVSRSRKYIGYIFWMRGMRATHRNDTLSSLFDSAILLIRQPGPIEGIRRAMGLGQQVLAAQPNCPRCRTLSKFTQTLSLPLRLCDNPCVMNCSGIIVTDIVVLFAICTPNINEVDEINLFFEFIIESAMFPADVRL